MEVWRMRVLVSLLVSAPLLLHAQWNPDIAQNTRVCDVESNQIIPAIIADGQGGTFHAWTDYRVLGEGNLFIQHLNADGVRQWANDGVQLTTNGAGHSPGMLADGAGGVWVAWYSAFYTIRLQHIDADGTPLFEAGGRQIYYGFGILGWPVLSGDGAGGVLVVLSVQDNLDRSVAVQRVDAEGNLLWGEGGTSFTAGYNNCDEKMRVVQGDSASIIMLWGDVEHRLQRLDTAGNWRWGATGVTVGAADGCYVRRRVCSDGDGGVYTCTMFTNGDEEAYVQRVRADGTLQWPSPGIVISRPNASVGNIDISADGVGGAFVLTMFNASPQRVQVAHMDATGTFTSEHVLYEEGIQTSDQCQLGATVNGVCPAYWYHLPPGNTVGKFQRVAMDGTGQWAQSVNVYAGGGAGHMYRSELVSHPDGSNTFGWEDVRYISLPDHKIRAHHISADFVAGITEQKEGGLFAYPVPTSGLLTIVSSEKGAAPWILCAMDGRTVMAGTSTGSQSVIDLASLAEGCYMLSTGDGSARRTQRVVVAR